MTATTTRHACPHCSDTFATPQARGGHVAALHRYRARPRREGRQPRGDLPKWLRAPREPRPGRGLHRETDVWPGRP